MTTFEFRPSRYPTGPGCYLMKDSRERVLYVGKAKNLRRRLGWYFRPSLGRAHTRRLAAAIADVEVILVNNETESLILEHNLINHHAPPFNRDYWRQAAGYAYIALTDEALPRLVAHSRRPARRQAESAPDPTPIRKRFGPYLSRRHRDALLDFVDRHFRLRVCQPLPKETCHRYDLGWCGGICAVLETDRAYQERVQQAVAFLARPDRKLIRRMREQMQQYADRLAFERAGWLRDRLLVLNQLLEVQIVERQVGYDQDVLYFGDEGVLIMKVHRGRLLGLDRHRVNGASEPADAARRFLLDEYARQSPPELIVNLPNDPADVARTLSVENGRQVRVVRPQRGVKRDLLRLCERNYLYRVGEG